MYSVKDLFDFEGTMAEKLLLECKNPWDALKELKAYLLALLPELGTDYIQRGEGIIVHKTAIVADSAYINGPCVIGPGSEIRHCAFIRGIALIGECCVVGNSSELKNSLLLNHVQLPHYNYAGDSVFGNYSHMGAGAITSNVKADHGLVSVNDQGEKIPTGLKKFGALLGDHVEVGCNSVLNPGSIIGRESRIYPLSFVRGLVPSHSIYKCLGEIAELKED